ncbi:MAG: SsrA-binding protein SmpB [bacterium]
MKDSGEPKTSQVDRTICVNRRARHDYWILETFEAGIVLVGSEVKSIRQGKVSLQDSYATVENGEVFLLNMHITPYDKGSHFAPDPRRSRKLLLHKNQIKRLAGKVIERGLTLIPLRVYLSRGRVKIEIALARGKAKHDRRHEIAKREAEREIREAF